jgi:hypothetical protein
MLDRELMLAWMALCGLLALILWAFGISKPKRARVIERSR